MNESISDWNYFEAGIWAAMGAVFLIQAGRSAGEKRRLAVFLSATLLVFGVTDLVEAGTGAWWEPCWLGVWKGACIVALIWGIRRWRRNAKSPR